MNLTVKTRAQARHSQAPCDASLRPQVLFAAVRAVQRATGASLISGASSSARARPTRRTTRPSVAAGQVAARQPLDVRGKLLGGGLEAAQLAAEAGGLALRHAEAAAEVDLEALDLLAVRVQTSWPLRPMSATWVRAQAFGQPLMWIEMSASKSPSRSSSWATSSSPRALVSTIASLQYSMPVQAIVPRRQADGRASSPISAQRGDQRLDLVVGNIQDQQLLVRREPHPVASRAPRRCRRACASCVPDDRPTTGAAPT